MNTSNIMETIKSALADALLSIEEMKNNDLMITVVKDRLLAAMTALKAEEALGFTMLMNHLGADYGDRMAVIYNIYSPLLGQKATVKAFLDRAHPEVESLMPLFRGIDWFERETYDLLGIRFSGHANLKRLLLPEDWEGHPLRKDYAYPGSYNGITTARPDLLDETDAEGAIRV